MLQRRRTMLLAPEGNQGGYGPGEMTSPSGPFKLLNLANEFERAGVTTYSIDLYTKILDKYPDTFEAVAARLALFLIANRYENEGKKETAISLIRRISTQK